MDNPVEVKSFQFAVRIVKLCKHIQDVKKEFTLTKQLLRSGTSIGANVAESQQAQSRADFIAKLSIALKEAAETDYWLRLMRAADYLTEREFASITADCKELEKMLTAILRSTKSRVIQNENN
ncbi:MAG: four helix bundle protein [Firmicutes bacterium]|nr:four helix bundle protein [Bacillota bacterium]